MIHLKHWVHSPTEPLLLAYHKAVDHSSYEQSRPRLLGSDVTFHHLASR